MQPVTPELAAQLVREGADAAREYRERVKRMWAVSADQRRERAR